ncbi:MAG TPA: ABC transporter permease [Methanothrix sp.]|mgnify:CR=1 FL=1|nr:ABC transporter permease [Methanothrix sp.]OPY56568.1 MAG: macrolide transporter ATP-binding /permease protein [Methanosaeta sp. PtaU1.Bin055]HNT72415.1 ABC transporter permease [Methanothrix sp.]HOI70421.1 ABC transporter permease [Methanothrix sp.]
MKPKDMLEYVLLSFRADRRRALMSSLGIIIGVISIVALLSVGQGLYGGVTERFSDFDMDLITVRPGSGMGMGPGERPASTPEEPAEFDDRDVKIVENVLGVEAAYPLKTSRALLSYRGDNTSATVVGLSPENHDDLKEAVARGRFLTGSDYKAAVVSHEIAEEYFRMDISPGNQIRLYSDDEDRYMDFKVVGVLEEDEDPTYASNAGIYITHRAMEEFLDAGDYHYDSITVRAEDSAEVEDLAEKIEKELSRIHRNEAYNVEAMTTRFESMLEVLSMIKYALAGIGGISLVVGAIGISNVMMLTVRERTSEIGVMKAIGATAWDVRTLYLLDAGMLGLVSSVVGIVLGVLVSDLVGMVANIPQEVTVQSVALGLVFGVLITTVAGIYPANRAAVLDPIVALRGE